jgi:hypothetical protein
MERIFDEEESISGRHEERKEVRELTMLLMALLFLRCGGEDSYGGVKESSLVTLPTSQHIAGVGVVNDLVSFDEACAIARCRGAFQERGYWEECTSIYFVDSREELIPIPVNGRPLSTWDAYEGLAGPAGGAEGPNHLFVLRSANRTLQNLTEIICHEMAHHYLDQGCVPVSGGCIHSNAFTNFVNEIVADSDQYGGPFCLESQL